ncbi:hypothetical protein [Streptomyces sp. NPDC057257]|uniref:hypothetical protein n=1 Tax=Streptomyces sp. NPDC057257 TaxID=3346071 RepID=UPI00363F07E6
MSHTNAGSFRRQAYRRMSRPVLLVMQLLLVAIVAAGALVTNTGRASAQDEPNGALSQGSLPGVMYRGDSRYPNDIFANGFVSRGTNYDLVAHVRGDRANNSGYISTSGTRGVAEQFARSQGMRNLAASASQPRCQGVGWSIGQSIPVVGWLVTSSCQHSVITDRTFVYTINPQFAQFILHVPDQLRGDRSLHDHYASQDEWAFFRRIPPQAITGVHIYTMEGRANGSILMPQSVTFRYDRWVANPNYNRNFRYNPITDHDAHFSWDTGLNIPPVQANPYQRGCEATERCRGGNG